METTTTTPDAPQADPQFTAVMASKLQEDTICLDLRLRIFGTRERMDDDEYQTAADKEMTHASKDILESKELAAIKKHDGITRNMLRKLYALPSTELRGGVYRIPVANVSRVEEVLAERRATRRGLISKFMDAYKDKGPEGLIAKAKAKLKSVAPADYPDPATVEGCFGWEQEYISYQTPTSLKKVSEALFKNEWSKASKRCAAAAEDIMVLMRSQAQGLIDHLVDRLSPDGEGKRKVFRDTAVQNVTEFLSTFDARNVLGDKELATLMKTASSLLKGVDAEQLRKQEGLRNSVTTGLAEVKAKLDGLVTTKGRKFKF